MAQLSRPEPWPSWAKALLVALVILAVLVSLPWIFMLTAMAANCVPMMNGMRDMMGGGMMH
jgi:hypothetical protein